MKAERKPIRGGGSFTRGAEIWMHQARLSVGAMGTALIVSLIVGVMVGVFYFYAASSEAERTALDQNIHAQWVNLLSRGKGAITQVVKGEQTRTSVQEVLESTSEDSDEAWRHIRNGCVVGGLSFVAVVFMIGFMWVAYGQEKMADKRLRGAELVSGGELGRLIRQRKENSPYEIAGVPMRVGSETLHTAITGSQGTGKSQQFFRLMERVRERGKRAIVYDPTGEFVQAFYREGKDILMNPLDQRSPNWNVWCEAKRDYDFDALAAGLIPDPAEADPFWALAGRNVLKDVIRVLGMERKRTNKDLYDAVAKSDLAQLYQILQNTAAASYVNPTTERTGMSLKMTVQNQLESFRFLHDQGELFSIREWIANESDSWLFISTRESMREALKPVLSLWIDVAIKSVLDLEPIHRERLWFFIDELPTLQKLDILKLALTNTRKYGLCCVLGFQDFSQINEIYGKELAKTIISGCQTKLLLRVTDGEAASSMAELMGKAEVDETEETLSYGKDSSRDGVSIFARRNLREIVLPSEITRLPDRTGYLNIPGDYPVARVEYEYIPSVKVAPAFIERGGFQVVYKQKPEPEKLFGGEEVASSGVGAETARNDGRRDNPASVLFGGSVGEDGLRTSGEVAAGEVISALDAAGQPDLPSIRAT